MLIITEAMEKALLLQATSEDLEENGALQDLKIALYTDGPSPSRQAEYDDYTAPTFTGYAVSAELVLGAIFRDEDGNWRVGSDLKQFLCTGGTPDEDIKGAMVFKGTVGNEVVYAVEEFEAAINIGASGDGLRYGITLRPGVGGDYGTGVLVA